MRSSVLVSRNGKRLAFCPVNDVLFADQTNRRVSLHTTFTFPSGSWGLILMVRRLGIGVDSVCQFPQMGVVWLLEVFSMMAVG